MKKAKRVLALVGVLILAGLYLLTLISAILVTPATKEFFRISLLATLIIPILIYVYALICRLITGREEEPHREKGFDEVSGKKEV